MKKFVKPLVIAASVAAVAGIGAVSFAKWEAGSDATGTVSGKTDSIVTVGNLTVSDNLSGKTLMPWDQVDQYDAATNVKVIEISVSSDGEGDQYFSIKLTSAATNTYTVGKLKVFAGETYAAPSGDTLSADWKEITTSDQELKLYSGKAYVVLDSGNTADMNKDFSLTITAAAQAPSGS